MPQLESRARERCRKGSNFDRLAQVGRFRVSLQKAVSRMPLCKHRKLPVVFTGRGLAADLCTAMLARLVLTLVQAADAQVVADVLEAERL